MNYPTLHPSVQLAWALANLEANRSNAPRIEPAHFLLACLRIADDAATQEAELVGLSPQLREATADLVQPARRLIGLSEKELTAARRGLARALHRDGALTQVDILHRSEAARDMFVAAARRAVKQNASELTLLHLLSALLDNLPASLIVRLWPMTCLCPGRWPQSRRIAALQRPPWKGWAVILPHWRARAGLRRWLAAKRK
jgi:hypothetical protein